MHSFFEIIILALCLENSIVNNQWRPRIKIISLLFFKTEVSSYNLVNKLFSQCHGREEGNSSFNSEEQASPNSYPFAVVLFINIPNSLQFFYTQLPCTKQKGMTVTLSKLERPRVTWPWPLPDSSPEQKSHSSCCSCPAEMAWGGAEPGLSWNELLHAQGGVTANSGKPLGASMLEQYQAWIALLLCCVQHSFHCRY